MDSNQEKILAAIRIRGPVLPANIAKVLNTNILIASAHLSELVDSKKIHYSHTKVGSSPVYYIKGQESKLQELYPDLNEKEKKAFDELKTKKVLKDTSQPPLMRVTLRNIKDFAVPINVNHDNKTELFWKWYLISNEEAASIIKSTYEKIQQIKETQQELEKQKQLEQEKKKQEELKKKLEEEKERIKKKLGQEKLKIEQEKKRLEKKKIEQEKQQRLLKEKPVTDPFFLQISAYLNKKNIQILNYNIIKKKKEVNLNISIPSAIGPIEYFCIAKKKRKISDSDLNAIYVQRQLKKKPVLFLTTGTLSKKAATKLTDEFKEIIINKLE